jgi:hypothetical protein
MPPSCDKAPPSVGAPPASGIVALPLEAPEAGTVEPEVAGVPVDEPLPTFEAPELAPLAEPACALPLPVPEGCPDRLDPVVPVAPGVLPPPQAHRTSATAKEARRIRVVADAGDKLRPEALE